MRTPVRLLRELGFAGFATFQLVVGGNVAAALIHPLFVAAVIIAFVTDAPIVGRNGAPAALVWLFWTSLGAGYLISAFLGWRGLVRRGLASASWALAFVWLHWLLLSFAAWRALLQLWTDPYRWEKTDHGLARSSRLEGARTTRETATIVHPKFRKLQPPMRRAA